jgi:DNA-directed RNA polymerase specialized sigma24 family protein
MAQVLGVSENAIKRQVPTGLAQLREELDDE